MECFCKHNFNRKEESLNNNGFTILVYDKIKQALLVYTTNLFQQFTMVDYFFKSYSYVNKIMFMPQPSTYDETKQNLIWIPKSTHTPHPLPAVYVQVSDPEYIVIYSHGNAMDIGFVEYIAADFSSLHANFLGFEYTGYGIEQSGQTPSEYTAQRDMRAVYHFVREKLNWPADRIILYGQSIGSGVACYGANYAKERCGEDIMALILHSPYTSIRQLAAAIAGSVGNLIADRFNSHYLLQKKLTCPLLLAHGNNDQVIPFSMSEKLIADAQSPLKALHTAHRKGHNDMSTKQDLVIPFMNNILPFLPPRESIPPPPVSCSAFPKDIPVPAGPIRYS